jgi:hypothetical protein
LESGIWNQRLPSVFLLDPGFIFRVETSTANELSAAFRTVFLIAIRMVLSARHYIAIGTAEPVWKM